jgi:hypothetical protein
LRKLSKPTPGIDRIIDANANRLKEGLRVCEEILRFIIEDAALTGRFKTLRHRVDGLIGKLAPAADRLRERASDRDVGEKILGKELTRASLKDVFFANSQRAKESCRVLEEIAKLKSARLAVGFKDIRYRLYDAEKKAAPALERIRHRSRRG